MRNLSFVPALTVVLLLLYIQTNLFAQLNVTYTKTDNSTCTPRQECICHGKLTSITVLYRGPSGVNVKVYKKNNFRNAYLLKSETNVQDGQIITVSVPVGTHFDSHAYFEMFGAQRTIVTEVGTSCGQIRLGEVIGNYTIIGYTDIDGNSCDFPLCTGSIQLTVTGGALPYMFFWNNGATSMNLDNLCNGKYRVRIRDGRGRTARAEITIGNDDSACNDNNVCTVDHCVNGTCRFIPIYCRDGDQCTKDECDRVTGCFNSPIDCSDNNPCTEDRCHHGHCHNDKIECDDDDKCTKDECVDGVCVFTIDCSDNSLCTEDICDDDKCKHIKNECDDGDECTKDKCKDGSCEYKLKNCDDDNACTLDYCDDGRCKHNDEYCDDSNPCTDDRCHHGDCENKPVRCDDDDRCTIDACDSDGTCLNTLMDCDDGEVCTEDLCRGGTCRNDLIPNCSNPCLQVNCEDGDPCTNDECNNGQCSHLLVPGCGDPCANLNCEDGDPCTIDICAGGQCHYTSITCDDHDLCTSDLCANGQCVYILADCNDSDDCTSDECENGQCIHIVIPACGNPCANSSLVATVSGHNPIPCSACNGQAIVGVSGGEAPYSYLWTTGETSQSIGNTQSGGVMSCINSGGTQYTSFANETFIADANFAGNTFPYSRNNIPDIANTVDDELYLTERNSPDSMFYLIPVANGQHDVALHFAELYFGVEGGNLTPPFEGKRVFDVFIEGVLVLDNYDINADVGPATATVKSFTTNVTDGMLTIKFISIVNRAKISAICVKPENVEAGLCAGTYSVTISDANGCTATNAVTLCSDDPCLTIICDDNNACTIDDCVSGECLHNVIACDDSNACTTDQCLAGQCISSPINCNDNDNCTNDECINGECHNTSYLQVSADGVSPIPCNACNGTATANPSGGALPYGYLWSNGATSQSIGGEPATTNRCINSGGTEFVSTLNDTFEADWDYSGVTFAYTNNNIADIANTDDDYVFKSERNTMDSMSYNIPVTNGKYDVELYFAELYFGIVDLSQPFTGKRIFDVFIEGVLVLDNYDINASVGPATADIKTFTTMVSDQTISIKFVSIVNRAKVSGICVRPNPEQPAEVCAGSYNVTVTDATGCAAETGITFCNGQKLSANDMNNDHDTDVSGQIAKLIVYPIPFQEIVKINFRASGSGEAQIRILDMLGQNINSRGIVFKAGDNYVAIDIENRFAEGMYFMEFRTGEDVEYVKLYKSR